MRRKTENYILGSNIKRLRKENNIKQMELAKQIGVDRTSLSSYENEKRMPDILVLWNIADIFHISIDELVGRELKEDTYHQG